MDKRRLAILILGALAALRFVHWGAPLTDDEAYMVRTYANQPLLGIATSFEAPNNHILLAMILHLINALSPKELFVTMAHPGPLQSVSILASVGALVLLYKLAESAFSSRTARLATTILGLSYWHLIYSHQMRGYSLSTSLLVLTVWLVHEGMVRARHRLLYFFPVAFAAFNYTVASNLYISTGLALGLIAWLTLSPTKHSHRNSTLALLAIGVVLTTLLYIPILDAMREAARQGPPPVGLVSAMATRLGFATDVLGSSLTYRVYLLSLAVLGLVIGLRRPHKNSLLPLLSLAMISTPILATTVQGIVIPFARTFVPLLPFWALLVALGLEWVIEFLTRRIPALTPVAPYALAAFVVLPAAGGVFDFIKWNSGMNVRGLMAEVSAKTRNIDDFVLIHPTADVGLFGGRIDWEYYAFAAGLPPQHRTASGQDVGYLLRKQYFIAEESELAARKSLERSRIDPMFAGRMRALSRHGKLQLFSLTMDDSLLREYQAVSKDESADPSLKAQALTGLAFIYLDSDRLEKAAAHLEKAKQLQPENHRIRFYLALTRYLELDDKRAAEEFSWIVANDTTNARAPFFYGDALAGQGRSEEALLQYAWYEGAKNKANAAAWLFSNRAPLGAQAVKRNDPPLPPAKDAEGWANAARAFEARGSLERAAIAWRASMKIHPSVAALLGLAKAHVGLQEAVAGEQILRRVLATGAAQENRVALAKVLYQKRSLPEARKELETFLHAYPDHAEGKKLLRTIRRL